jgi:putative phosphoribosyl transferase
MLTHSHIDLGGPMARGALCSVAGARGLVVFAHADGASRTSRRNEHLAQRLQQCELSTLLFDLLSAPEADQGQPVHDVDLLARRLLQALDALPASLCELPLGLLGSDSGAAAALRVAAQRPRRVDALVALGGSTDLAAEVLGDVRTPTLLLVGAADPEVRDLNRQAFARLRCEKRIDIVPRASHLFLEAGALDDVAHRTGDWFCAHLVRPA